MNPRSLPSTPGAAAQAPPRETGAAPVSLDAVLRAMSEAVITVDDAQRILVFNPAAERLLGCSEHDALGTSLDRFIPPRARAGHARSMQRFGEDTSERTMSLNRVVHALRTDGTEIPVEASISKVAAGDDSRPQRCYTVLLRDVGERQRVLDALRDSEARFRTLVEQAGDAFLVSDTAGQLVEVNHQACDSLGIEAATLRGMSIWDLVAAADVEPLRAAWRALQPGERRTVRTWHRRREGTRFPVEMRLSACIVKGQRLIFALVRDTTERETALADLQRLQERYRRVVEQSPEAIWVITAGVVMLVNRACLALFGADAESRMVGQDALQFFPDELHGSMAEHIERIGAGESVERMLQRIRRLDGEQREVEFSAAPVPDHGLATVQMVMRDVTERRRTARLLRESREQLRHLSGNLISVREEERRHIARELHDELGQRLSVMKMQIAALERELSASAELRARLAEMRRTADELVGSVRRIAADLRPPMLDDLGLEAAIEWLAGESARHAPLQIKVDCRLDESRIAEAAKTTAYRMVQEALNNVTRHAHARHVDIDLRGEGRLLRVRVQDDGTGFDASRPAPTHSFGLVGMRERARLLGGTLDIRTSPGHGTCVELRLPLEGEAPLAEPSNFADL